jgi:hypothetical protein
VHVERSVGNVWEEQLEKILLVRAGIRKTKTQDACNLDGRTLALEITQEGHRRVSVQPDTTVDDTSRKSRTSLDLVLTHIGERIDLVQTHLDVPLHKHTCRGRCGSHTVLFDLPDPTLLDTALYQHELVGAESSVHKSVDKGRSKVVTR